MSSFAVTPPELANAGGAVARGEADLVAAAAAVRGTAGAAAGTPCAGACETLVDDAGTMLTSVEKAVEDLSRALARAASNYSHVEQTTTACYAPGAGP